jgi:hypothetical protein
VAAVVAVSAVASIAAMPPGAAWRPAAEYVHLFAPPAYRNAYRAYVTATPIDDVLRALQSDGLLLRPPGAWEARALLPQDAFGASGSYDPSRLARLYGARRVRVARGPRGRDGRVEETWLLVSPYPDPALSRLESGTLLVVLRVPDL